MLHFLRQRIHKSLRWYRREIITVVLPEDTQAALISMGLYRVLQEEGLECVGCEFKIEDEKHIGGWLFSDGHYETFCIMPECISFAMERMREEQAQRLLEEQENEHS